MSKIKLEEDHYEFRSKLHGEEELEFAWGSLRLTLAERSEKEEGQRFRFCFARMRLKGKP